MMASNASRNRTITSRFIDPRKSSVARSFCADYADYDREFERYTTLSVSARDFCGIPESVNEYHKNKTENSSQIACYWRDNGSGYECLEQFAAQHEQYGD